MHHAYLHKAHCYVFVSRKEGTKCRRAYCPQAACVQQRRTLYGHMHACFPAPDMPLSCCRQLKEIRDYQRHALTPGQPPKIEEPEESEEEEEEEEEEDDDGQVSAGEEEVCL